jgi:hypothetical protein
MSACHIGSAQLNNNVEDKAWAGKYQLLYMSPEIAINSISKLQKLHNSQVS